MKPRTLKEFESILDAIGDLRRELGDHETLDQWDVISITDETKTKADFHTHEWGSDQRDRIITITLREPIKGRT